MVEIPSIFIAFVLGGFSGFLAKEPLLPFDLRMPSEGPGFEGLFSRIGAPGIGLGDLLSILAKLLRLS